MLPTIVMVMKLVPDAHDDLVLAAIHRAPIVEATPEEMAAFDEGIADIRAGRVVAASRVRAQIKARERE